MADPTLTEQDVEEYIDRHGMEHMLTMLSNIAYEKVEHVLANYDDRALASAWRRGAKRIDTVARFEDWPRNSGLSVVITQ
jgi:hypothetical protein